MAVLAARSGDLENGFEGGEGYAYAHVTGNLQYERVELIILLILQVASLALTKRVAGTYAFVSFPLSYTRIN